MDDDEIDCQVPQSGLGGHPGNTLYCHLLVEMMQLSSTAKKRLSTPRALRQTAKRLIETVQDLRKGLEGLTDRCAAQHKFHLDRVLDISQLPNVGMTLRQMHSLQFHYFCLVLDINTPLSYPWSGICSSTDHDPTDFSYVEASIEAVAQASRSVTLATRQIIVDAGCPAM